MKKFRTWYDTRIEEVEAVSETAKFVTISYGSYERREIKRHESATDANYHDTWQEARQFLIDRELAAIANLERQLVHHQETLQKIEAMQS